MNNNFLRQMALDKVAALRSSLSMAGDEVMNMIAPDNFEYYNCALELTDYDGNTVAYLSFDIMPNNIVIQKQPIVSIVKTITDTYTITNDSFNPFSISIQGTFGRKLRLLTTSKDINESKGFSKMLNGNIGVFFDSDILVKTGYGVIKMMQKIIEKSNSFNDRNDYHYLIFHNYAFNTHNVVKVNSFDFNISTENNFMWFYSLNMTAIDKAEDYREGREKVEDFIKKFMKTIANEGIKNLLFDIDSHISQYGMTAAKKLQIPKIEL